MIQLDASGGNCILLFGGANQTITPECIDSVLGHFDAGDILVLQNEINMVNEILMEARRRGLRIVLNPSPMNSRLDPTCIALADWLFVNETEAEALSGCSEPEVQLRALAERFPQSTVLLTLGQNGAIYAEKGKKYRIGVCRVGVVDTTAAGDTFTGYFMASILNGDDPADALLTATRAAALAVGRKGAAQSIPCRSEVEQYDACPEEFGG